MIVYGDPQSKVSAAVFISALREQIRNASNNSLDQLRTLLIGSGQLEQAMADLPEELFEMQMKTRQATDCAAAAFHFAFKNQNSRPEVARRLRELDALLEWLSTEGAALPQLMLKVPEGFAFYSLYPEQYILAAEKWAGEIGARQKAVVIGIRSIGTTLSAVVTETLRARGWRAHRFTVRPTGHPYHRSTTIARAQIRDAEFALIVDEGPGLSGSSMAAVAQALVDAGFLHERIVFFPAHNAAPGPAATDAVRHCWTSTRRCVASLDEVRWHGASLLELLRERTRDRFEVRSIHDVSGGLWRHWAYENESDWPPAFARFEHAKYLVELENGQRVLWKFSGLHEHRATSQKSVSSEQRATIEPLRIIDTFAGFEATQWLDGVRLARSDVDPSLLRALAHYVLLASKEPANKDQRIAAVERLVEMTSWNTKESVGSAAAEQIRALTESARSLAEEASMRSYGDGRFAPCEFVRANSERIFKTDNAGHDCDHTIIGQQSLLWDVAGVIVEWNLNETHARTFLDELHSAGVEFDEAALQFYRTAYAAFRVGMAMMCASNADPCETARLQSAVQFYRAALLRALHLQPERERVGAC